MVAQGKKIEEIRPEIQSLLDRYPITSYNNDFTFSFLRAAGFRITTLMESPMEVGAPIVQIPNSYAENNPDSRYNRAVLREKFPEYAHEIGDDDDYDDIDNDEWKWPSFQEAWHDYRNGWPRETHRSREDVLLKADLIVEMIENVDYSI